MNIMSEVRCAKCVMLSAVVAFVGVAAVAEPTVTVGEVKTGDPWSNVTINYTLGGMDEKFEYKVVFDVTAGGQTASVTNDAARLTDGAATKVIDTVAIFGKQVADVKAKVKVTLVAVKPTTAGVQLWANGPFWAECNVGGKLPGDYGGLYMYNDDEAKNAAESLGAGWRLPTSDELGLLNLNCTKSWETCKDSTGADRWGYRFTSNIDTSKSIFLPAAGYGKERKSVGVEGCYWSSESIDGEFAYDLYFLEVYAVVASTVRGNSFSVRAVR